MVLLYKINSEGCLHNPTALVFGRYLFIFWLKNPAAFHNEFWITFFNIWSKGSSLIFNCIWCFLAEHLMVNYYVCSGVNPTEDFKKPLKQYASIEMASVLINLFVYARIKLFKLTDKNRHQITNKYLKKVIKMDVDRCGLLHLLQTYLFSLESAS